MKNIKGIEIKENDIKNAILIAKDLQFFGYNFDYFCKNYTQLLKIEDSKKLWDIALKENLSF